jgi:hypothetical protein
MRTTAWLLKALMRGMNGEGSLKKRYACRSEEMERVDRFVNRQMIKGWSSCSEETVAYCSECLKSGLKVRQWKKEVTQEGLGHGGQGESVCMIASRRPWQKV